jgi:hypothetical protein
MGKGPYGQRRLTAARTGARYNLAPSGASSRLQRSIERHAEALPRKGVGVRELKGINGWARPVNAPVSRSSARSPNSAGAVSMNSLAELAKSVLESAVLICRSLFYAPATLSFFSGISQVRDKPRKIDMRIARSGLLGDPPVVFLKELWHDSFWKPRCRCP